MENLKHTKGEWISNPHSLNKYQVWCIGTKIAACDNSVQSEIYREKSDEEMEANAKLIAAAPDLLEALIHLTSRVRLDLLPESTANLINKAIEKATK